MELLSKKLVMVTRGHLESYLNELILGKVVDKENAPSGDDVVEDYIASHFIEPTNDSYIRIYVNSDTPNPYPSDLDQFLPDLKKELKLGDDRYEFFLMHVSW